MSAIIGIAGSLVKKTTSEMFIHMSDTMKTRTLGCDKDYRIFDYAMLFESSLEGLNSKNGIVSLSFGEKTFSIICDGELYNKSELIKILKTENLNPENNKISEIILLSYILWGEECVNRLYGVFAFAIWEHHNKRLVFARDHLGIRPFFYTIKDNSLIFASEIKAILKHNAVLSEIETSSAIELMLLGPGKTPNSGIFKSIFELPRAYCGCFEDGKLKIRCYHKLKGKPFTESFDTALETVKSLVKDAIQCRISDKNPICAFLSGGLDSSIITAIAAQELFGKPFKTFSVDYIDNEKHFKANKFQPDSDRAYIELMKNRYSLEHQEIYLDSFELIDAIYDAVEARDLPGMGDIDSSLLLFSRKVAKQLSSKSFSYALSGEGADEIFGGYPWFLDKDEKNRKEFPWSRSTLYRAGFIHKDIIGNIDPKEYINGYYQNALEKADLIGVENENDLKIRQLTQINIDYFLQTLATRNDRMSMNSGIMTRFPFCDIRIAEYLYNIPSEIKLRNNIEKALLRQAFKDIIPEGIISRKKSPYPKTHNPIFEREIRKQLEDVTADPNSPLFQLLDRKSIIKILTDEAFSQPWYGQLMQKPQTMAYFLQINHWLKVYNINITKL